VTHPVYLALCILAITVSTILTRSTLVVFGSRVKLPPGIEAALRYAPACALAAIIAPDLLVANGAVAFNLGNARLLGGIAACAVFLVTRSVIGTISGGMATFWFIQWIAP
jgi:branched-subunit amino acid transport protein